MRRMCCTPSVFLHFMYVHTRHCPELGEEETWNHQKKHKLGLNFPFPACQSLYLVADLPREFRLPSMPSSPLLTFSVLKDVIKCSELICRHRLPGFQLQHSAVFSVAHSHHFSEMWVHTVIPILQKHSSKWNDSLVSHNVWTAITQDAEVLLPHLGAVLTTLKSRVLPLFLIASQFHPLIQTPAILWQPPLHLKFRHLVFRGQSGHLGVMEAQESPPSPVCLEAFLLGDLEVGNVRRSYKSVWKQVKEIFQKLINL